MRTFCGIVALLISVGSVSAGPLDEAKTLFERYAALEAAFDSSVADLYADTAVIKNKRTYFAGMVRETTVPAAQYKNLIRTVMPLAKAKNDYSTYSETTYTEEGKGVRITSQRYSVLKKYTSPISIFVEPDDMGKWLITEELSESRPF